MFNSADPLKDVGWFANVRVPFEIITDLKPFHDVQNFGVF